MVLEPKLLGELGRRIFSKQIFKWPVPFFEFFNKYAFIIASYLVNVVKFFRKNINNSIKEYPILYKNLKAFRKNYKKAKALQINEIKLLFSTW